MASLPTGTVTFLFTDIEGSTILVRELGEGFRAVLEAHHETLRRAIAANRGVTVSTEGDAFFAVFSSALDAVRATAAAQRELADAASPAGHAIRVRMGLHTGDGQLGGDNYIGVDVNRAARIAAAGHGGQVLLSAATHALVEPSLPAGLRLRDLGPHRLKDLPAPEHIHQLVIDGLPGDFPPLRSLAGSPTNLVPPATALVGRERELAQLAGLLTEARLLTLTGPGGTGKTRLALELATRSRPHFSDGVFFVPLETLTERPVVAAAIGHAIGARMPDQGEPEDAIAEHLSARDLLLVLDNFEQVTSAAPLVSRLLSDAALLRVVATSRVPLHLTGEQEYPAPPLAIPEADVVGIEAMAGIEAIALFIQCARRIQPGFRLTDANATAVSAICRRLDGLPLAIELAAARLRLLSPEAMLARLDHALSLLAGGSVDLPVRQQTLRAAIEWSYRLLDAPQATLFRRLSVFSGGWTIEAAEQVTDVEAAGPDVFEALGALVEQSLVRLATVAGSNEPRFEMLQLIREFAAEALAEAGEETLLGRRHAEWALAMAEQAAPVLEESADAASLDRLAREHDNLRAALRWSVEQGEREMGLRLATAAWRFWQQRGHVSEGRSWFGRLMPGPGDQSPIEPGVLAAAHTAAGGLAYWQGDMDEADAHYRAALDLDLAQGRADRQGDDVYNLAFVAMIRFDLETARMRFAEAADLFTAAGQTARLADTTAARGATEMRAGNLDAAIPLMEEGRRLHLEAGNVRRATDNAMVMSYIAFRKKDLATARRWLLTSVAEARDIGDVSRWPFMLEVGTALALAQDRPRDAVMLAAAGAKRRADLGGGAPSFVVNEIDQIAADARAAVEATGGAEALDLATREGAGLDDEALTQLLSR
jgi:predicted ATPase/class 3 adenylate cyclase